jgi:phosphatidyl-myo-inositol alpha-mannosyltransferase
MRVAVTHPTCWPEVRRGSERLLHDLSHYLAGRGHVVTVISTAPQEGRGGTRRTEQDHGVRHILLPRQGRSPMRFRGFGFFHRFGWQLCDELLLGNYDVVHCLNYHDAWGASLARRRGARFRLVYQMTGIPVRRYFRRIPLDGLMFAAALRRSDVVIAISNFAAKLLREEYGLTGLLIPAPTDTAAYPVPVPKPVDQRPLLLFVGDADEPRKGACLLAQAFAIVKSVIPGCQLGYCGSVGDTTRAAILAAIREEWRQDVTFLGVGDVVGLPALYESATVVVNPAIWEAFGMVLVEALAAGTPVVGCDHAGIPDIISNDRVGRLFEPFPLQEQPASVATNVAGLAAAIQATLGLAGRETTLAACRSHAARFSWQEIGPMYEAALAGYCIATPSTAKLEPSPRSVIGQGRVAPPRPFRPLQKG